MGDKPYAPPSDIDGMMKNHASYMNSHEKHFFQTTAKYHDTERALGDRFDELAKDLDSFKDHYVKSMDITGKDGKPLNEEDKKRIANDISLTKQELKDLLREYMDTTFDREASDRLYSQLVERVQSKIDAVLRPEFENMDKPDLDEMLLHYADETNQDMDVWKGTEGRPGGMLKDVHTGRDAYQVFRSSLFPHVLQKYRKESAKPGKSKPVVTDAKLTDDEIAGMYGRTG